MPSAVFADYRANDILGAQSETGSFTCRGRQEPGAEGQEGQGPQSWLQLLWRLTHTHTPHQPPAHTHST